MTTLHYSTTINAPKEKVWHTMLDLETYKQWTGSFYPGSYYEGSWDKGSEIKFVAETDGKIGGMYGRIAENKPYEFVSIEYLGEIVDGNVETEREESRIWIGAHENYRFTEQDGVTTVDVELSSEQDATDFAAMFDDTWPKSLAKVKELAEQQ